MEVFNTYREFLSRDDKSASGVSPELAAKHPDYVDGLFAENIAGSCD